MGLLFLCEALTRSSAIILLTTMALVGRRLAPDPSLSTLPLALVPVATTLTTIPAAQFMRRRGRRPGFALAAIIGMVGATVAATGVWLGAFSLLCVGGLLIGCVNGFATYYRFTAGEVVAPEFRTRAISLVMAGGVVAAFVGSTLATQTKDLVGGHPFVGPFTCIIVLQALIFLIVSRTQLPPPAAKVESKDGRSLGTIARNPTFIMAVLGAVASWGLMSLVMNATPLSMERHHHAFSDTANVIQWHVLGMYAPAFFTGSLIKRFGERPMLLAGITLIGVSAWINTGGTHLMSYLTGLTVLGLGWNFLFVSCTTLITNCYRTDGERARVQSANDFLIFATMVLATFSAGTLEERIGWLPLNQLALLATAVVGLMLLLLMWREQRTGPADNHTPDVKVN
ncbi:MAG TPA: MFS transporter [Candidatus Latescibacteria bacterium]|nr:MFS transporter [Candidatus Latescibacterota bacterium]HJP33320.1 MFS transporter [Candidatus Latescibacterota bacterium]